VNELVVRVWPVTEATRTALRLAEERGQLVSAERRGDVVRVVLRDVVVRRPAQPTTTGPRQVPTRRLVAVGVSVGAGLGAAGAVAWGVVELLVWAAGHVAVILGGAVALLLLAALLTRILVGGGDSHPCNR